MVSRMSFLFNFLICLFVFGAAETVFAQAARFDAPTNGSVNVSCTPTIRIYTQYKIDSASIPFAGFEADSLIKPILIIPRKVYDSIPEFVYDSASSSFVNVWNKFGQRGVYENPNDTTLEFSPHGLMMEVAYVAIIYNVHVIYPNTTVHQIPDSNVIYFTTVLPPHKVVSNSLLRMTDQFKIGDTLKLIYNRKLEDITTAGGPLVEFYHLIENPADTVSDTTGSTPHYLRDTISALVWIEGADSITLYAMPSGLSVANHYEMAVFTSRLTGDSTQDERFNFRIKDRFALALSAKAVNPLDTLPAIPGRELPQGTYYVPAEDTIFISAPKTVGAFSFLNWECPTDTAINNYTADSIQISRQSSNLGDLVVWAVYDRTHIDTLTVNSDSGGIALVYRKDFTLLPVDSVKPNNDSLFFIRRGEKVILMPKPDSAYEFDHWFSSDNAWNGNPNPIIIVDIGSNIDFIPVFSLRAASPFYKLCGNIAFVDLGSIPEASVAVLTAPNPPPCYVDLAPTNHNVDIEIKNPNWGLRRYEVEYKGNVTQHPLILPEAVVSLAPGYTHSVSSESSTQDPDPTTVTFIVERLETLLNVEIAFQDGSKPTGDFLKTGGNSLHWTDLLGVTIISTAGLGIKTPPAFDPWVQTTKPRDQWTCTYKAGQSVTLYAVINDKHERFEFVGWSSDAGYEWSAAGEGVGFPLVLNYSVTPKKVKAIFKKKFQVESITLIQDKDFDGTFTSSTYSLDPVLGDFGALQKEVRGIFEGIPLPSVQLEFSEAVDQSTLNGLAIAEQWTNIISKRRSTFHPSDNPSMCIVSNGGRTVTWTPYYQFASSLTDLQRFTLYITPQLKADDDGEPLLNPQSLTAQTNNPDVKWVLERIHVYDGNEILSNTMEPYLISTNSYITVTAPSESISIGPFWIDDGQSSVHGIRNYNVTMIEKNRVRDDGIFTNTTVLMDYDPDWLNELISIIATIAIVVTSIMVLAIISGNPEPGVGTGPNTAANARILISWFSSLVLKTMTEFGVFNAWDDYFGMAKWSGTMENWWGAHPSYESELVQEYREDGGEVDVRAKVTLK